MKALCYDIGGTDIKYGIVEDGKIIEKYSMKTNVYLGREDIERRLVEAGKELLSRHEVCGVGISCAGSIDCEHGKILIPGDKLKTTKGMNFTELFKKHFNLMVAADNDVNCFGQAESVAGAGITYDNFLMMTIGTGIGGAIIYDDKVMHGLNYNAGEFGRMIIGEETFENLASTSALIERAKNAGLDVENGLDVYRYYDAKNETAIKVVNEFYHYLAIGIANLVYIFNPEAVMIGGGITNRPTLREEIHRELKRVIDPDFYDTVTIEVSIHKNNGGLLGGYYNIVNKVMGKE
ncbi:MAG: ROK family protein [Bacilli bacterium]|nr:ROK family protein [Bacilli bacterium]